MRPSTRAPSNAFPGLGVLGRPALRSAAVAAGGVLVVAIVAGAVRLLPLFLADHVPLRLIPVLARGVAGVAVETALFVAPSIGWALAAAKFVDRGEARALFALGVRPVRIVAAGWPAVAAMACAAALAAALWGAEASAPGRALQAMIDEARLACVAAAVPIESGAAPGPAAVADVPILGASWVCFPGERPRLVGPAPSGEGAFAASAVRVSDDLRAMDATDLEIVARGTDSLPEVRVRAGFAALRGLPPVGRASNLGAGARAALLASASTAFAMAAGTLALAAAIRSRAAALAIGAAGPAAGLLVFSALERGPAPGLAYLAVVGAGLAAIGAATASLAWGRLAWRQPRGLV